MNLNHHSGKGLRQEWDTAEVILWLAHPEHMWAIGMAYQASFFSELANAGIYTLSHFWPISITL